MCLSGPVLQRGEMYVQFTQVYTTSQLMGYFLPIDFPMPVKNIVCIPGAAETRVFAVVFALFLAGVSSKCCLMTASIKDLTSYCRSCDDHDADYSLPEI